MATLTEEQWEIRFTATHEGILERDDERLDPNKPRQCWTVLEVDGVLYVIPGLHLVNAVGYVSTFEPWTDADLLEEWYW